MEHLPGDDQVLPTTGYEQYILYYDRLKNLPFATYSSSQGKYAEAEPLLERSQIIHEKTLGPEHLDVASVVYHRGMLLKQQVGIEFNFCWGSTFVGELLKICMRAPAPQRSSLACT